VAREDKMTKLFMAGHVETQYRSDQIVKTVMFALFLQAQNRFVCLLIEIKWFLLVCIAIPFQVLHVRMMG
jgi:hypothetical protein